MTAQIRKNYTVTLTALVAPSSHKDYTKTVTAYDIFQAIQGVKESATVFFDAFYKKWEIVNVDVEKL